MPVFAMYVSELDRGFLTGFLEGEACFTITEQNGGQSYSCGVTLALRDDEQDLLEWLVALTGLGRLTRTPRRATSRPQIAWTIGSQEDCRALIRLISVCGFHGRRTAELELWADAVDVWTQGSGDARRSSLGFLKQRLHAARKFGGGAPSARPFTGTDRETLGYISGLVCAEGCFGMNGLRPRFSMHLRGDERPLLELLRATTGLGRINEHRPRPPLNPSCTWNIGKRAQLEQFAERMYAAGLPGRKGAELETWAISVAEVCSAARLRLAPRRYLLQLGADHLRASRRYRPSTRELLRLPGRNVREDSLAALRAWSASADGRLGCGGYTRWRRDHPSSPTRNTIAAHFGTWHAAMVAAGLADRAARGPTRAGGIAGRQARRAVQRARVLDAVRRFEAEHRRLPRAMEFFKWRSAAAADAPSQSTVYALFPGGWEAVLRAFADEQGLRATMT